MTQALKIMACISLAVLVSIPSFAGPISSPKDEMKITPISGVVLVCSGADDECDDRWLQPFMAMSPIRFLDRAALKKIMDEQRLQYSGLTADTALRIGKIAGASHILFYKKTWDMAQSTDRSVCDIAAEYQFRLTSVETTEIEYTKTTWDLTERGRRKLPNLVEPGLEVFFTKILGRHQK